MKNKSYQKMVYHLMDKSRESGFFQHDIAVAASGIIILRLISVRIKNNTPSNDHAVLPARFHWETWHQLPVSDIRIILGTNIPDYIMENDYSYSGLSAQMLSRSLYFFSRLSDGMISELVNWIASCPINSAGENNDLLQSFDELLNLLAHEKLTGIHRTPSHLSVLIFNLISLNSNNSICDPACGVADLLVAAKDYLIGKSDVEIDSLNITGYELNETSYFIGVTRMLLSGFSNPHVNLEVPDKGTDFYSESKSKFDFIISNASWDTFKNIDDGKTNVSISSDMAGDYITWSMSNLRDGGRAILIVPQSFLYSGGINRRLRQNLIENNKLEIVMSLPTDAFFPYKRIASCILIIKKGGNTDKVRMVNSTNFFSEDNTGKKTQIHKDNIKRLAHNVWIKEESEYFWNVDLNDIRENQWDLTPRRRDNSKLLKTIKELGQDVELKKLSELCEISVGAFIRKKQIFPEQKSLPLDDLGTEQKTLPLEDLGSIPLIRLQDVKNGATQILSTEVQIIKLPENYDKSRVQINDILLSRSGDIGKVGIVNRHAGGAIASHGFYILKCNKQLIEPKFLLAYLQSSEVKKWLNDWSVGANIGHLRLQNLADLPVGLPTLGIQSKISSLSLHENYDVLNHLNSYYNKEDINPIYQWIENVQPKAQSSADLMDDFDFMSFSIFEHLAETCPEISNKESDIVNESSLENWYRRIYVTFPFFEKTLLLLKDKHVYFYLLLGAQKDVAESLELLTNESIIEIEAEKLSRNILRILNNAINYILKDIKISISASTNELSSKSSEEIKLSVINDSALTVRNLSIKTSPDWGSFTFDSIEQGKSVILNLTSQPLSSNEKINLSILWSGLDLRGNEINGYEDIAFDVVQDIKISEDIDFGGSPYVCGDPVRPDRQDVFCGREDILDQIHRYVTKSGNVVLLEGNRRAGKTSILSHLEGENTVLGWLGVYCSLQGAEGSKDGVGVPTVEIFREITKAIIKSLSSLGEEVPLPNGEILPAGKKLGIAKSCREGIGEDAPFSDFREYFDLVLEILEDKKLNLLLMLDEFDKIQEGIDNGITSPQVPENIRFLVQSTPRFSAILTGSRRLKRLREEYWSALFGLGTRVGVSSLAKEDASKLITNPVKGILTYSESAIDKAYSLTAGQPYLLQCLCNRIFNIASQKNNRSITTNDVNEASDILVEDNEHFASLWGYTGSERCRFILALCHKEKDSADSLHFGDIQSLLSQYGIEVNDDELIKDIEHLRELEMLEMQGGSNGEYYSLGIPMMGTWIDKQQDYEALMHKARNETEDSL